MLLHADSDLTARLHCSLAGHLWRVSVVHVTMLYFKAITDVSGRSCSRSPQPILVDLRQTTQAGQQTKGPVIVWTGNLSLARTTQGRALPVTTTFRYILRSVAPFSFAMWHVRCHTYHFMPQTFSFAMWHVRCHTYQFMPQPFLFFCNVACTLSYVSIHATDLSLKSNTLANDSPLSINFAAPGCRPGNGWACP